MYEHRSGELDKPASQIVRHALPAILETAIRGSNAQYDDPEILERLDVRLFQVRLDFDDLFSCFRIFLSFRVRLR